jgi:hypothetical protein
VDTAVSSVRRVVIVTVAGVLSLTVFAAAAYAKPQPTTNTTVDKATAADKAAATAALLQLAELPAGDPRRGFNGWQGSAPTCTQAGQPIPCPVPTIPSMSNSVLSNGDPDPTFEACAASMKIEAASSRYRADSPDYWSNPPRNIGNSIYVFPNAKKAKAYLSAYTQPEARDCFQHSITTHVSASSGTLTYPEFDTSTVPAGSLDEGVGFNALVTPAPGSTSPGSINYQDVRYRAGRAVIFLSTYNNNYPDNTPAPFPGVPNYLAAIADRLNQQLSK